MVITFEIFLLRNIFAPTKIEKKVKIILLKKVYYLKKMILIRENESN